MEGAVAVGSVRYRALARTAGGYVSPRFALPRRCLTSVVETARVGCLGRTPWPIGAAEWL